MDPGELLIACIFWTVFWGVICYQIGSKRNNRFGATLAGVFLGPIGVALALVVDKRASCPKCKMKINDSAEICPHCHSAIEWSGIQPKPQTAKPKALKPLNSFEEDEDIQQVHFKCRECREALTWPANDAGNKVLCTNCGAPTVVPDIFGQTEKKKRPKLVSAPTSRLRDCPDCETQVSIRAAQCPKCGCPLDDE